MPLPFGEFIDAPTSTDAYKTGANFQYLEDRASYSSLNLLDYATSESNRTAIRSGNVDMTAAWDDMVADAVNKGNRTLSIPGGDYICSDDNRLDNPGFLVRGETGQTRITKVGFNSLFRTLGAAPSAGAVALDVDAAAGALSVTVVSGGASGFAVGDTAMLRCEQVFASGQPSKKAEFVSIQAISGSVITFWAPIHFSYPASQTAQLVPVSFVSGIGYDGITAIMDDTIAVASSLSFQEAFAFDMRWCLEPVLRDCAIKDGVHAGVFLLGCLDARISQLRVKDMGSTTTGSDDPSSTEGTPGFGYAIIERALNAGLVADGLIIARARHGYTTGAMYASIWAYGCPVGSLISNGVHRDAKEAGWDTHETGFGIRFDNLQTIGGRRGGFQIRSLHTLVGNCSAEFCQTAALWIRGNSTGSTHGDHCRVNNFNAYRTNLVEDSSGIDWRELGAVCDEAHGTRINGLSADYTGGGALTIGRNGVAKRGFYSNISGLNPCQLSVTNKYLVHIMNAQTDSNIDIRSVALNDTDGNVETLVRRDIVSDVPIIRLDGIEGYDYTEDKISSETSFDDITYINNTMRLVVAGGRSYSLWDGATESAAAVPAVDILYFYPFIPDRDFTFIGGLVHVITGGAGSSAKFGIYETSPLSNRPLGAPMAADNTGVTTQVNNQVRNLTMSGTVRKDVLYWICTKITGTPPALISVPANHQKYINLAGTGTTGLRAVGASIPSTYSDPMPTILEDPPQFSAVSVAGIPILALTE